MEFGFSQQVFEKYSNIKFHDNPSSGSRVVPYGRTDGRTDPTKVIVASRNFANASKKTVRVSSPQRKVAFTFRLSAEGKTVIRMNN
jgi:hypothetical protein